MTTAQMGRGASGVAFIVSAGVVYEIIAAACSSPQTTEINASTRAETLMKWVHLGVLQAAGFIAIAAYIDRPRAREILAGGLSAMVIIYAQYWHAKKVGLEKGGPGTESTSNNSMVKWR